MNFKLIRAAGGIVGIAVAVFGFALFFSVIVNFAEAPPDAVWINMGNALIDAWRVYWRFAIPAITIIAGLIIALVLLDNSTTEGG